MQVAYYPTGAPDKLGFNHILDGVRQNCVSEEGRAFVDKLQPTSNPERIETYLRQTAEFKDLLEFGDPLPLHYVPPAQRLLARAALEGGYLSVEEFNTLLQWLRIVRLVADYFKQRQEKYPHLGKLLEVSTFDTGFVSQIERIVTREGYLRADASPQLERIRRQMADHTNNLRQLMQRLLRDAREQGWTDERELTIRSERLVLPIKADFKGRVKGFVHDVSGSGQTVYMEPVEALTANNALQELRVAEQNEIIRILTDLTDRLRPLLPEYKLFARFLIQMDVIRAKAQLAIKMQGVLPVLSFDGLNLRLYQARHPLLILQKSFNQVVPLSLELTEEKRWIIISGPNAGGKSVALQTVGLLQMMLQAGLLVPVNPQSEFRIYRRFFIDIGDDQSIQNDLSTYTSHLTIMNEVARRLDKHALVLIDEFGSGTDPSMGGAIAEALLEEFIRRNGQGIITTHFGNLKEFAEKNPPTRNAAMRFDVQTITPTYELELDLPGSSYAFEIAGRVGVPGGVIERARKKVGSSRTELEHLLRNLKQQEAGVRKTEEEAQARLADLEQRLEKQKRHEEDFAQRRKKILAETREAAGEMLNQANLQIEAMIDELKQKQADKNAIQQVRKQLNTLLTEQVKETLETPVAEEDEPELERLQTPIEVGDWVCVEESHAVGRVLELQGKRCIIAVEDLRTSVKLKDVVKVKPPKVRVAPRTAFATPEKIVNTARHLDVRGMRVEQALPLVEKFMDDAIVAGLTEAIILHGKGTGSLRDSIRYHLRHLYREIKTLRDAPDNQGGTGITICTLA